MDKKAIFDYLDDPSQTPAGLEEQELVALLRELEAEPDTEPGQVYWNQFNGQLQSRIEKSKTRPWFLAWPAWSAALLCAALLFFRPGPTPAALSLADLSNEGLDLISETYAPLGEDEVEMDLANVDFDLLLESYDTWADPFDGDGPEIDVEELKSLWEQEG